jgi:hypothetical protein
MISLKTHLRASYTAMNFRREQPSTMVQAVAYRVKLSSDRACERSEADTHGRRAHASPAVGVWKLPELQ